jgi:heptosyltransferase III
MFHPVTLKKCPQWKHIILSRIDHIGDTILTLPMVGIIKKAFPECRLTFITHPICVPILKACPQIDHVVGYDSNEDISTTIANLKLLQADILVHISPHKKLALAAKKAAIPLRIGTLGRWFHWVYCNTKVHFSRAKSTLHEAQLNCFLLKPLGLQDIPSKETLISYLKLLPPSTKLPISQSIRNTFIIFHPGSHGNGREWPLKKYIECCKILQNTKYHIILTGSKQEDHRIGKEISLACPYVTNLMGKLTIEQLMFLTKKASALIASGTGPLHLAAAIGIPALGLFPKKKIIGPHRWGTLGKQGCILASKGCRGCRSAESCLCMHDITATQVATWVKSLAQE